MQANKQPRSRSLAIVRVDICPRYNTRIQITIPTSCPKRKGEAWRRGRINHHATITGWVGNGDIWITKLRCHAIMGCNVETIGSKEL